MFDILGWVWLFVVFIVFVAMVVTGVKEVKRGITSDLDIPTVLLGSAIAALLWPLIPVYILWDKYDSKKKADQVTMSSIREKTDQLEKQLKIGKYAK